MIVPSFRPDGSVVDLTAIAPADIDFGEMASALSKIARFNGRYGCEAYVVAQHSVFVADALFAETGDAVLAGCGLLHDGHEYLIGDLPSPTARLIAHEVAVCGSPTLGDMVRDAIERMKTRLDGAIFAAAGIGYPQHYPAYVRQVKDMDERMLRAEGLSLFGKRAAAHLPAQRRPVPPLRHPVAPWGPMKAELAFLDRLEKYLNIVVRAA